MLLSQYKPLAQKAYCAAIVLLLILSEVFSSNIQAALPTFSSLARLALTSGAVALLGVKIFLLTDYEARWQPILAALVLAPLLTPGLLNGIVAVVAGIMLWVAAAQLLPAAFEPAWRKMGVTGFCVGVLMMILGIAALA